MSQKISQDIHHLQTLDSNNNRNNDINQPMGTQTVNDQDEEYSSIGPEHGPIPLVICGPSGVGKGTLISRMMKEHPHVFGFSVSHTTRKPRPGESHGCQYHFISDEEMKIGIEEGRFLESAFVHCHYYGTSFQAIRDIQSQGKICILDIDVQGVRTVKTSDLSCRYLFIAPPTIDHLKERLMMRSSEKEHEIEVRLRNAIHEIAYGHEEGQFEKVIINDDFEAAYRELVHTIKTWYPHINF